MITNTVTDDAIHARVENPETDEAERVESAAIDARWAKEESEETNGGLEGLRATAATVEIGEYLYDYDEDTVESTSMPSWLGDDSAAELREILRARDLDFEADDAGWIVIAVAS